MNSFCFGSLKFLVLSSWVLLAFYCLPSSQLYAGPEETSTVTFVEIGAPLKYFKGVMNPPVDWTERDFDDDKDEWINGMGPVGFGEPQSAIVYGTVFEDMRRVQPELSGYTSVFMRTRFTVNKAAKVQRLELAVRYDDGFIAFLNGNEIGRSGNMGTGPRDFDFSPGGHEFTSSPFNKIFNVAQLIGVLEDGENVLSVQLHNVSISSNDLVFEGLMTADVFPPDKPRFVRGVQCDNNSELDIGDPIYLLRWQFNSFYPEPDCVKSCDMNDDGFLTLSDAVYGLEFLFKSGPQFPAPYPSEGEDTTDDDQTCVSGEVE